MPPTIVVWSSLLTWEVRDHDEPSGWRTEAQIIPDRHDAEPEYESEAKRAKRHPTLRRNVELFRREGDDWLRVRP